MLMIQPHLKNVAQSLPVIKQIAKQYFVLTSLQDRLLPLAFAVFIKTAWGQFHQH